MIKMYLCPLADVVGYLPARSDPIMFLSSLVGIALKTTSCDFDRGVLLIGIFSEIFGFSMLLFRLCGGIAGIFSLVPGVLSFVVERIPCLMSFRWPYVVCSEIPKCRLTRDAVKPGHVK